MSGSPSAFFEVLPAVAANRIVLSSPHSGRICPASVLQRMAVVQGDLRILEDGPTERLGLPACRDGATLLGATFSRAFVDLNRSRREIDPFLFGGDARPARLEASVKVQAGLGVVPTKVGGRAIYGQPLGAAALLERVRLGYLPYHRRLAGLMRERCRSFGRALLIDLHSMPVEAAAIATGGAIDVTIGDRFGASADRSVVEAACSVLRQSGLVVVRNRPYAGGFITEHYGRPARQRHALQLEVRRDLFMDPQTSLAHAGLTVMAALVRTLAAELDCVLAALPAAPAAPTGDSAPADDRCLPRAAD